METFGAAHDMASSLEKGREEENRLKPKAQQTTKGGKEKRKKLRLARRGVRPIHGSREQRRARKTSKGRGRRDETKKGGKLAPEVAENF